MTVKLTAAAAALIASLSAAHAQNASSVVYHATFENAVHHEAQIEVRFDDIGDAPLELTMSRASPGRYAIHEFAKNVYDVKAVNGAGEELAVTQTNPYSWQVDNHDGAVRVTYTLYADRADGTYSQIDLTHAHLNMPATFMWAKGFEDRPIQISFEPAQRNWKAATQLVPTRRGLTFTAPDLQYFLDSPVELSNFDLREWRIGEGDARQTIRLAVHHQGDKSDMDIFAEKAKKVVDEQIKLFGEAPRFDYGDYVFIADYLPHASRDGMEHRNSTILSRTDGLYEGNFDHLGTLSHEFIHAWNVERLRPKELEPFDFTRANPTPSLWFAEGFTSYYGPLTIRRAGENSLKDLLRSTAGQLNSVVERPGRAYAPPKGMSIRAPFVDAATTIDPSNNANTFISYYSYGAVIGAVLDLTLRQRFEDISLDDYMRHLWREFGRSETPFSHEDLLNALGHVTGDKDFATDFFARYIEDSQLPDLAPLFEQAGIKYELKNEGDAWLGRVGLREHGDALIISANTIKGSPLYEAGLERGDDIRRIGRFTINSKSDWDRALERHEPGDEVAIEFSGRSGVRKAKITFIEDQTIALTPFEDADLELSEAHKTFRQAWLGDDAVKEEN